MAQEQDTRIRILDSILTTPHNEKPVLDRVATFHRDSLNSDPLFYGHLAAWYAQNGSVRDHKETFVAALFTSDMPEHRDAACALLQELPPYEVQRVVTTLKERFHKMPRKAKTAVVAYLRARESKIDWFDKAAVRGHEAMKSLYARLHVKPSARAERILFKDDPPKGSTLWMVKKLAKTADPDKQAELIVSAGIPAPIAIGAVRQLTPPVVAALLAAMTPSELVNNVKSLKEKGAYDNPDLKAMIEEKLKAAKTDKRISGHKAMVAADAAGITGKAREQLEDVANTQIRSKGTIRRPTAMLVDKSGSMTTAIEYGKLAAAAISGVSEADLFVWAFDVLPHRIEAKGKNLSDWEAAFRGMKADGGTGVGGCFVAMARSKQVVEQVVIVTDEEENQNPLSDEGYLSYVQQMGVRPDVIVVNVGNSDSSCVTVRMQAAGISVQRLKFTGDYVGVSNLIPLLAAPTRLDLLLQIMEVPLPKWERNGKNASDKEE